MASTYNSIKGIIHFLNQKGCEILQIKDKNGENETFYACNSFDPPSSSAIGSNPYSKVLGYDITELLEKGVGNGAQNVFDQLEQRKRSEKPIERQYSVDYSWIFYAQL